MFRQVEMGRGLLSQSRVETFAAALQAGDVHGAKVCICVRFLLHPASWLVERVAVVGSSSMVSGC